MGVNAIKAMLHRVIPTVLPAGKTKRGDINLERMLLLLYFRFDGSGLFNFAGLDEFFGGFDKRWF